MSTWEDNPTSGYDRRDIEQRFRGVLDRNENLEEALRGARLDLSTTRSDLVKANDYAAKCERAIAALAKALADASGYVSPALCLGIEAMKFADELRHRTIPGLLTDPLVAECVADAEARQDARRDYP